MTDPDSRAEPDDALILRLVREHFSADFRHQLLCQRQVGDANEDAPTFAIQQFALGIWQAARRTLPPSPDAGVVENAIEIAKAAEESYRLIQIDLEDGPPGAALARVKRYRSEMEGLTASTERKMGSVEREAAGEQDR